MGISLAAPVTRLSAAPPLAIAVWRLGLSLVVITVPLAVGGEWRQWRDLTRRELAIGAGAGVVLALHFWSWMASLGMTTVAASVGIVSLQPVFVAAGSALWLGERPTRRQLGGVALAVVGGAVVALADAAGSSAAGARALRGDALALLGAVTAAAYYLAGRRLRARLALWPYVALVYGACFATLVALALATGVAVAPQPPREIALFALLAAGPMLLGHTGMNWALRYLPAYAVNLTVLGEPVGATMLAYALPGIRETPSGMTLAGGACILAGVIAASRPAR